MNRRYLLIGVVTALASGAAGVTLAHALETNGSGQIYSCVEKSSGQLRIVAEAGRCRKTETELSWNQAGQGGSNTAAWYSSRSIESSVPVPNTGGTTPPEPMISLTLPDPPAGGGYLMHATFGLRNTGPVDAELVCGLGNIMAHQFFSPVSDQSPSQVNLGGVYGSDTRTYTITGVYTGGGTVHLGCGVTAWQTSGAPNPLTPVVVMRGALLTAERIDVLTMQAPQ